MTLRSLTLCALAASSLAGCAIGAEKPSAINPASCHGREFDVYFEGQSSELSEDARTVIDAIGETVAGCRITQVKIVGSADEIGAATANEEVSALRTKVLADYLEKEVGWPRDAMELLATGERGAVTDGGLSVPMRGRARVSIEAVAP